MECKVYFTYEAVSIDNEITLQIALKYEQSSLVGKKTSSFLMNRNAFPLPIEFHELSVHFNIKEYDSQAQITESGKLKFNCNEQKIFSFNFPPQNEHAQRTLEVDSSFFSIIRTEIFL